MPTPIYYLYVMIFYVICTKVSLLLARLAAPREGHLEVALHVMSYLRGKHNSHLTFDPSYTNADIKIFNDDAALKELYGDVTEPIPPIAPDPDMRGKPVNIRAFVDSNHAGDKASLR